MTHKSRTYVNCALVAYSVDGRESARPGVCFPPARPSRRRSPDLSAYDRLDPEHRSRETLSGTHTFTFTVHIDGRERLQAALDGLEEKMKARMREVNRRMAEQILADVRGPAPR